MYLRIRNFCSLKAIAKDRNAFLTKLQFPRNVLLTILVSLTLSKSERCRNKGETKRTIFLSLFNYSFMGVLARHAEFDSDVRSTSDVL